MPQHAAFPRPAAPLLAAFALGVATLTGCGTKADKIETVPVSGKVAYADGSPVTSGMVTFTPDDSKGNTSKNSATGSLDASGNYKLTTSGHDGAPAGWYKVSISAAMPGMGGMGAPAGDPGVSSDPMKALKSSGPAVNQKYSSPGTSGLTVEVSKSPAAGAYDLKVSK